MLNPADSRSAPLRRSQRRRRLVQRLAYGQQIDSDGAQQSSQDIVATVSKDSNKLHQAGPLCKECKPIAVGIETFFETRVQAATGAFFHEIGDRSTDSAEYKRSLPFHREYGLIIPESVILLDAAGLVGLGLYRGCRTWPLHIDYGRVQGWLKRCNESHSDTCGRSKNRPMAKIYCIDCHTRAVVEITRDDAYIALSYLWGPPISHRSDDAHVDSSSPRLPIDGVPLVVEDAMRVVTELRLKIFVGGQILHRPAERSGSAATNTRDEFRL